MNNTIIELDLDNSIIKEESLTIPKVEYLLRLKPSESNNRALIGESSCYFSFIYAVDPISFDSWG